MTIDLFTNTPQGDGTTGTSSARLKRPITDQPLQVPGDASLRKTPGQPESIDDPRLDDGPPIFSTTYPASEEGESAGDVQDVRARVHPRASGATSPAAEGKDSSTEQATGSEVETVMGVERAATRTPPARDAGRCGSCGESSKWLHGYVRCTHLPQWHFMSESTTCTFAPVRWVPQTKETLAKREAQEAIDEAADDAERHAHGWSDRALEFVRQFAEANRGRQYLGQEIVRASLQTDLPQPPHTAAWGKPIQQAARAGLIKRVGFTADPHRHANSVPLWEST